MPCYCMPSCLSEFGNDMEEDVADDVSGNFKKFMVSLMSAGRDENEDVDFDKVKKDAQVNVAYRKKERTFD